MIIHDRFRIKRIIIHSLFNEYITANVSAIYIIILKIDPMKIKIVQMDTDAYPDIAAQYGVQKIPNLTFLKDGHDVDQAIGYVTESELIQKIDAALKEA